MLHILLFWQESALPDYSEHSRLSHYPMIVASLSRVIVAVPCLVSPTSQITHFTNYQHPFQEPGERKSAETSLSPHFGSLPDTNLLSRVQHPLSIQYAARSSKLPFTFECRLV
jgi:hypothetical protein